MTSKIGELHRVTYTELQYGQKRGTPSISEPIRDSVQGLDYSCYNRTGEVTSSGTDIDVPTAVCRHSIASTQRLSVLGNSYTGSNINPRLSISYELKSTAISMMETATISHRIVASTRRTEIAFRSSDGSSFRTFYGERRKIGDLVRMESTEQVYVNIGLDRWSQVMDEWEALAVCLGDVLFHISTSVRRGGRNEELSDNWLQYLADAADVASWLEREYSDMLHGLEDGSIWLTPDGPTTHSYKQMLSRMQKLKRSIVTDLVGRVNTLFQRTSNILSIEVGRRSYAQNSSVKRLTWVNIIFLPMIAASGFFGMNIAPLKDFPALSYYLVLAIPLSVFVFGSIYVSKHYDAITRWTRTHIKSFWKPRVISSDIEMNSRAFGEAEFSTSSKNGIWKDGSRMGPMHGELLVETIQHGAVETLRQQLSINPKLNLGSRLGDDMMNKAAATGNTEILRLLLSHSAKINGSTMSNEFPLMHAVQSGGLQAVKLLIRRGADIWRSKSDGEDCFMVATERGFLDILSELLEAARASEPYRNHLFRTTKPSSPGNKHDLRSRYSAQGLNVYHYAVKSGNMDIIKLLLQEDSGMARSLTRPDERSLLMFESVYMSKRLLKYLVRRGAYPDHYDKSSSTALFRAVAHLEASENIDNVFERCMEVIEWLAKYHWTERSASEIRRRLERIILPLVKIHEKVVNIADKLRCRGLLTWIFSRGLSVNDRWKLDHYHITCLGFAVWRRDRDMIEWLIGEAGARTNLEDFINTGVTDLPFINSVEFAISTIDGCPSTTDLEFIGALMGKSNAEVEIPAFQTIDGSRVIRHMLPAAVAQMHGKAEVADIIQQLRRSS
ncbi:ankyrin [Ascobolus immersus RN42]|uniref:Ankyrin n=1 Tax=Ascobolus immersus RN42 TaxID=1160509 RepID=A0A3N4IFQ1_ASCIM|nr:ankyrin [Ascobolus immersus RN42]